MAEFTPETDQTALAAMARDVLAANHRGDHTVPAGDMYPHAWLWDEVFTDIGLRHFDASSAARGITSLFKGQWHNGMVPNMIFTKGTLFGDPPFKPDYLGWSSRLLNKDAPRTVATSGVTQPPLLAEGMQRVSEKLDRDDRQAFLRYGIGRLAAYHSWIYRERNPNGNGLFAAVHPWETGMENTPTWMQHMASLDWGKSAALLNIIGKGAQKFRRDTHDANPDERASIDESLLYIHAYAGLVRARYDYRKLEDHYPLHIEDVHMSSVLVRNNVILEELAAETKYPLSDELQENMSLSRNSLEQLWDEADGLYYPRDAISGTPIKIPTIASLMPLYAGTIPVERAQRLVAHTHDPSSFGQQFGIPTVAVSSPFYRKRGYWSGPSWVNMNWLISDGEQRLGFVAESNALDEQTLQMVALGGMREYFSSKTAEGLGAKNFSWTAGLTVDIIHKRQ